MPAPQGKSPPIPRQHKRRLSMRSMAVAGWIFAILILATLTGTVIHLGEVEHFTALLIAAQPGWLLVALALQIGTYASEAAIWYILLKLIGHRQPLGGLVPLSLAKLFTDQAIPTGGLSGNIMVVDVLTHRGVPAKSAISALVIGIIVYFLAYLAMSLLALTILWDYHVLSRLMIIGALVLAAVALGLPVLLFSIDHVGRPRFLDRLARTRPVASALAAIGDAWPLIRRHPLHIGLTIGCQALIFLLDGVTLWVTLQAIGQTASLMVTLAAFMMGSIAASLGPFPLGLGGFEAACTSMLTLLGVPLEAAFTATFLLRGFTLWLPMLPGLWLARWELRRTARESEPT
ncbi:MAG: flippase-like domain-containing protein [Porticoccaceae bacterium]|nr:MAG: flippase-like domain-containing protein [Porticoccaceae bacterium]